MSDLPKDKIDLPTDNEEEPQAFLAQRLYRELPAVRRRRYSLATGTFTAIIVAFRLVLDADDEAVDFRTGIVLLQPMLLAADATRPQSQSEDAKPLILTFLQLRQRFVRDPTRDRQRHTIRRVRFTMTIH